MGFFTDFCNAVADMSSEYYDNKRKVTEKRIDLLKQIELFNIEARQYNVEPIIVGTTTTSSISTAATIIPAGTVKSFSSYDSASAYCSTIGWKRLGMYEFVDPSTGSTAYIKGNMFDGYTVTIS